MAGRTRATRTPNRIAEFRIKRGLSQAELGLAILKTPSKAYAQKKISDWENGHTIPTGDEISILAQTLGCDATQLSIGMNKDADWAVRLFQELRDRSTASLVVECCSSPLDGELLPEVNRLTLEALRRQLSLAFVLPYPKVTSFERLSTNKGYLLIQMISLQVQEYARQLQKDVGDDRVAVFAPAAADDGFLVLPVSLRQVLVAKYRDDLPIPWHDRELYTWIKTKDLNGLYPCGHGSDEVTRVEKKVWEAYFGGILDLWYNNHSFAEHSARLTGWQRIV